MNDPVSLTNKNITQKCCPHSLGKHLPIIETNGFILTETQHESNLSVTKHSHENANLACVLSGSFTEKINRKSFECAAQNILLKPPEESHSTHYNRAGAYCLIIEVQPEKLSYFSPDFFSEVKHVQMTANFNLIYRIYRELRITDDVSKMAIEGLTLELLAHFRRQAKTRIESGNPRWLSEVQDFIHDNFNNSITLSTVAETVGVHPSHLARVFRGKFHCSIGDYIRRLRLEYAAKQLIETEKAFVEIAFAAGFYDQSHFANAFRNYTGLTPTEYRTTKN